MGAPARQTFHPAETSAPDRVILRNDVILSTTTPGTAMAFKADLQSAISNLQSPIFNLQSAICNSI